MTEPLAAPTTPAQPSLAQPPLAQPRRPRQDALPEHTRYHDVGCDLFASCLACPLPRCRYDVPGGVRTILNRARDREMRELRLELALPVDEIARRFRVSRRTVFRVLAGPARPGCPDNEDQQEDQRHCEEGARS